MARLTTGYNLDLICLQSGWRTGSCTQLVIPISVIARNRSIFLLEFAVAAISKTRGPGNELTHE